MNKYDAIEELRNTVYGLGQVFKNDNPMNTILDYIQEELNKIIDIMWREGNEEDED